MFNILLSKSKRGSMNENQSPTGHQPPAPPIKSDAIQDSMGQIGRWHFFVFFCIFLLKFAVAWHQLVIIFAAPPVTFECSNSAKDKCDASCPEHVFDRSVFSETIEMTWDLVCDYHYMATFSQVIFMLGVMVGSFIFGMIADKFGRRKPLVFAVILQLVSGVLTAVTPWFWLYCVLRFVTALATGGTMTVGFVLLMELCGLQQREAASVLFNLPFNLGHLTLPLFAYLFRNWRWLQIAVSLPTVILISYYWVIPESPRWLFMVGRLEQATAVLTNAAKANRLPTDGILENLKLMKETSPTPAKKGNALDLFRTPNMRIKTLAMYYMWFVAGFGYFGVAQYVGTLSHNIFLNVAVSALIGVPGCLICYIMMKWLGRRWTLLIANLFTGVMIGVIAVLPEDAFNVQLFCASCGIIGMSVAFPCCYLYAGEIFPTVVRNVGVGTSSMSARVGTVIAPFVAQLALTSHWLPPLIFGVVSIAGAVIVLFLPETRGFMLPQTMEDGEEFGKKAPKNSKV